MGLDGDDARVNDDAIIDEQRRPRDGEVNVERRGVLSAEVAVLAESDKERAV